MRSRITSKGSRTRPTGFRLGLAVLVGWLLNVAIATAFWTISFNYDGAWDYNPAPTLATLTVEAAIPAAISSGLIILIAAACKPARERLGLVSFSVIMVGSVVGVGFEAHELATIGPAPFTAEHIYRDMGLKLVLGLSIGVAVALASRLAQGRALDSARMAAAHFE